jgi:hypothetical protein
MVMPSDMSAGISWTLTLAVGSQDSRVDAVGKVGTRTGREASSACCATAQPLHKPNPRTMAGPNLKVHPKTRTACIMYEDARFGKAVLGFRKLIFDLWATRPATSADSVEFFNDLRFF